jgi:hypothetical protein
MILEGIVGAIAFIFIFGSIFLLGFVMEAGEETTSESSAIIAAGVH